MRPKRPWTVQPRPSGRRGRSPANPGLRPSTRRDTPRGSSARLSTVGSMLSGTAGSPTRAQSKVLGTMRHRRNRAVSQRRNDSSSIGAGSADPLSWAPLPLSKRKRPDHPGAFSVRELSRSSSWGLCLACHPYPTSRLSSGVRAPAARLCCSRRRPWPSCRGCSRFGTS